MPIRERGGKWEWRFWVNGREYSQITDLSATERNRTAASRLEAAAHKLVKDGRADELRLEIMPFSEASERFLQWAKGENAQHPATHQRLKVSMASLSAHFGKKPVSAITAGDVEDFKAWRRENSIQEVTIRHDLHALSPMFRYAMKHNWARRNPVEDVAIPSDAESVRINVLALADEARYFETCLKLACRQKRELKSKKSVKVPERQRCGYRDLYDLGRLMILQGCRPEELRELEQANVNLERGTFQITRSKTRWGKRTLPLTAESRSILAKRLQSPGNWVFPSHRNPGKHIGSHQRTHGVVLAEMGYNVEAGEGFVVYDFRHTFASRAANERGMPLPILAKILGHSPKNLRSVMNYVHAQDADVAREMKRYEKSGTTADSQPVTVPEFESTRRVN